MWRSARYCQALSKQQSFAVWQYSQKLKNNRNQNFLLHCKYKNLLLINFYKQGSEDVIFFTLKLTKT